MGRPFETSIRLVWLSLLLPAIASCQQAPPGPELNPDPKHIVRISGRIPASLEVSMSVSYTMGDAYTRTYPPGATPPDNYEACKPRMTLGGLVPLDSDDYSRGQRLDIRRNGEYYETRFVADKYLPGECGWKFRGVGASVVKDGEEGELSGLIARGHLGAKEPYCKPNSELGCATLKNSDATPVIVQCEIFTSDDPEKEPWLTCRGYEKFAYKQTHIVTDDTRSFVVNFYDLAVDQDPVTAKAREAVQ